MPMANSRRKSKNNNTALWLKILIFVLIFVVAAIFFGKSKDNKKDDTIWQEGSMLRIGDTQVDYREGLIYLNAVQEQYEQYYGSDIWQYAVDSRGNTMGELIKEQVLDQIIYIKVVCKKADELAIVLSEEELLQVEEQTTEYMEQIQGSDLLLYGINADIARRIYADNLLARKTFEVTTLNVDTDIPDVEAAQRRYQTIAIRTYKIDPSGNRVSYEGTERTELLARVEALRTQALETNDFYKLAAANTEDATMLEVTGGVGDFSEEYEDTVLALKAGQVSDVIETTDYLYIFYCVTEFDEDATQVKKEEMISLRQEEEFERCYKEWKEQIPIEVNEEVWDSLGFDMGAEG